MQVAIAKRTCSRHFDQSDQKFAVLPSVSMVEYFDIPSWSSLGTRCRGGQRKKSCVCVCVCPLSSWSQSLLISWLDRDARFIANDENSPPPASIRHLFLYTTHPYGLAHCAQCLHCTHLWVWLALSVLLLISCWGGSIVQADVLVVSLLALTFTLYSLRLL